MILMVLVMTLELVAKATNTSVAADDVRVALELKQSVATMQKRLDELRSESKDTKETASRVARRTADELDAEIRSTNRQVDELTRLLVSLRTRHLQSQQKRNEAETKLVMLDKAASGTSLTQQRAIEDLTVAEQIKMQNEREAQRQETVRKQLAVTPKTTSTLVFNPPQGESLKPLLVEVSSSGIAVLGSQASKTQAFGWGLLGPSGTFLKWLDARDASQEYIVIMLRPSGLEKLGEVRKTIAKRGLELGLELVGDEVDIAIAVNPGEEP